MSFLWDLVSDGISRVAVGQQGQQMQRRDRCLAEESNDKLDSKAPLHLSIPVSAAGFHFSEMVGTLFHLLCSSAI